MTNKDALSLSKPIDHQQVQSRARRRCGLCRLASFALPIWLALAAYPVGAATVGSRANNADIAMPMGVWTTLNRINVPANDVEQYCVAVGSADVNMPNAAGLSTYLFTLVLDNAAPPMNLGQERTVQFVPGGPLEKEVTTTQGFVLQPGMAHSIFWLGRPDVGNPSTNVLDRSLSVVCDSQTNPLGIRNNNPEPLIQD